MPCAPTRTSTATAVAFAHAASNRRHNAATTDALPNAIIGQAGRKNRRYHHSRNVTYARYDAHTTTAQPASSGIALRARDDGHSARSGNRRLTRPSAASGVSIAISQPP